MRNGNGCHWRRQYGNKHDLGALLKAKMDTKNTSDLQ